ncbi:TBXAS1 [Acanthosepion pharaonis]|uniref:TBXAS1 n=1 Tax=Acanthosepion pharaonis TaxID=158019 RepID=A0A812C673_ACAPH|nr:TBXAS1 [Sepia pharaonis]
MDFYGVLYVPNFLLVTLFFLLSLYLYGRRNFGYFTAYGIKGPKPIAFLGNLKEIKDLEYAYVFLKWQKEYGDNYGIFLGSDPHLVVGDPEIIEKILIKHFSNFINRRLPYPLDEYTNNTVSFARDDHWKYLRTVLSPSYSAKKLREIVPMIEDTLKILEMHLKKIEDSKEPADFHALFSGFTMDVIATTGFGIKVDSQENPESPLVKNAKEAFVSNVFASLQVVATIFPTVAIIAKWFKKGVFFGKMTYFVEYCKELLKERRKVKNTSMYKDLLQLMLDSQLEGHEKLDTKTEQELKLENITDWRTKRGLTDLEIISQFVILFVAGFDSISATLSTFFHSIAFNPEIQERLYKEIQENLGEESPNYDNVQKLTYLRMCMEETLRMYPVGTLLTRETKEDCIIKGLKIPSGSGNPYFHKDFSEENKAKQIPFTYLPFGDGPRICPGKRLAELEFKLAAVQLLRKYRVFVCNKSEEKIELSQAMIMKPERPIWLKIERR